MIDGMEESELEADGLGRQQVLARLRPDAWAISWSSRQILLLQDPDGGMIVMLIRRRLVHGGRHSIDPLRDSGNHIESGDRVGVPHVVTHLLSPR